MAAGDLIVVDTHAHIYSEDEQQYPKIEQPLRPPPGTGTIEHLTREARANGIARVVVVQTSTAYRWDNRLIADTVRTHHAWTTGVCTLNPDDPDSPAVLARLVHEDGVRGTRLGGDPGRDPAFGHADHRRMFEAARQVGAVVCVLLDASYASGLAAMLEHFPDVPVVLDHCLNLKAMAGVPAHDNPILRAVVALAQFPNLYAKLTFAVTGSSEPFPCQDTHDLVRAVIDAFGPDRCMWGSDFPCELWCPKVTYGQHLAIFTSYLELSAAVQRAVLGGTADRVWFGEHQ